LFTTIKYANLNRKQIIYLSIASLFAVLIIVVALYRQSMLCTTTSVDFISGDAESYIDETEILKIVKKKYPNITKTEVRDIDIQYLEDKIRKLPQVKSAEVYVKLTGELHIQIDQRTPAIRVFPDGAKSFYIDTEGYILPVSELKSARVIVVSGAIPERFDSLGRNIHYDSLQILDDVFRLVGIINQDSFLASLIAQIHVLSNSEFELVPIIGNHLIKFGTISNSERKIRYLKAFYKNVPIDNEWNKIKYINLSFDKQIVCSFTPASQSENP